MATTSPSRPERISSRVYRWLLVFFPRDFRSAFGAEMALVFRDQCRAAWQTRRARGLLALWLRALADLFHSVPAEHLAALEKARAYFAQNQPVLQTEGGNMDAPLASPRAERPGGWGEALLAALPMLVIGLFFVLPNLLGREMLANQALQVAFQVMMMAIGLLVLVLLIVAWRRRFPRWSAAWMIIWLMVAIILPVTWLQDQIDQANINDLSGIVMLVLLIISGYLIYKLAAREPLLALIGVLPLVVLMAEASLEFVEPVFSDTTLLLGCLTAAGIVMDAMRSRNWRRSLILAVAFALLFSAAQAYASVFRMFNIPEVNQPGWNDFFKTFTAMALPRIALLVGPALGAAIRTIGLRAGARGGLAYRLVLLGVLVPIIALMLSTLQGTAFLGFSEALVDQIVRVSLYLGLALYGIGWALILRGLFQQGIVPAWHTALLVAAPVLLPFVLASFGMDFGIYVTPFKGLYPSTLDIYRAVGFAWAALAVVSALLMGKQIKPKEPAVMSPST